MKMRRIRRVRMNKHTATWLGAVTPFPSLESIDAMLNAWIEEARLENGAPAQIEEYDSPSSEPQAVTQGAS